MDYNFPISKTKPNNKLLTKPWELSFPKYNLEENKDYYMYYVDVPGIKKDDLVLSMTSYNLNISGERYYAFEDEDSEYSYSESKYGVFSRDIRLKKDVNVESCKADLINGVLHIRFDRLNSDQ